MYSVVLMAALSTSAAEPACFFRCCHVCCGCYGAGCYGCYGCYGCHGCYGGCYGCYGYYYGGCYGCYGGMIYSNYSPIPSGPAVPGAPAGGAAPAAEPVKPPKEKGAGEAAVPQARLIVTVPEDAKLYIDGHLMKSESGQRVFRTPRLDPKQQYYYDLRTEVIRDGKKITQERRVILRAGDVIRTAFADAPTTEKPIATADAGR